MRGSYSEDSVYGCSRSSLEHDIMHRFDEDQTQYQYTDDFKFRVVNLCDPSRPIFILSDAMHALKKGRNNVEKSFVSYAQAE